MPTDDDRTAIDRLIRDWVIDVTAGDDMAFAYALLRCGTPAELAAKPDLRLRLTVGLRKRDGRWQVTHEHHSFADDSQAATAPA